MSTTKTNAADPDITQRAIQLFLELQTSERPEAAFAELDQWVRADERHRKALREVERGWRIAGNLYKRAQGTTADPWPEKHFPMRSESGVLPCASNRPPPDSGRLLALGGSVLACLVRVFGIARLWPRNSRIHTVYETPIGDSASFQLQDHSTLRLNTDTKLSVYLRATVRDITLERGEALFDVAPEPQRPFRVSAGDVVFESHGSRFNLRRKDTQEIELVVIQGTLEVIGAMLATNSGPRKETRSYTVLQGQAMKVSAGRLLPGSPFQTLRNGEVAWTSGIIGVNGTLEEVVSEFNRYNTRKLLIADPALRTRRVAGWLKAKDPDTFAIDLLETHGIEHRLVTVDGREEILLGGMRNRRDAKHLGENP